MNPRFLAGAACAALAAGAAHATVIYVDADAWGANNGLSWFDAFNDLTIALGVAQSGDEVWVAEGTYKPLGGISGSFELPPGVKLLGGFRGTEADHDQRDPAAHITTLDGDLNGDDEPGFLHRSDNCRHVVVATMPTPGTVLDGFVVKGGYAVDSASAGGGIYVDRGSIKIAQCAFIANGAWSFGGGAYFILCDEARVYDCAFSANGTHPDSTGGEGAALNFGGSTLDVQRCTFSLNIANAATGAYGGAVCASGSPLAGTLDAQFRDCEFAANVAIAGTGSTGGACFIRTDLSASFTRCVFRQNLAGGMPTAAIGGAVATVSANDTGLVSFTACDFVGNSAEDGGAAVYAGSTVEMVDCRVSGNQLATAVTASRAATVTNSTIAGNSSALAVPAGLEAVADLTVSNTILYNNSNANGEGLDAQVVLLAGGTIDHSCVEGWDGSIPGSGSFDERPLFMDSDGADNIRGTLDDDYRLRGRSPCIDAGDNTAVPADTGDLDDDGNTGEKLPLDLDLDPRRLDDVGADDTGVGNAPFVDLGAYEFQGTSCVGDFDGNGVVDTRDVLYFLGLWVAGDPDADVNGDGMVNTQDVLAFLNLWAAGC